MRQKQFPQLRNHNQTKGNCYSTLIPRRTKAQRQEGGAEHRLGCQLQGAAAQNARHSWTLLREVAARASRFPSPYNRL